MPSIYKDALMQATFDANCQSLEPLFYACTRLISTQPVPTTTKGRIGGLPNSESKEATTPLILSSGPSTHRSESSKSRPPGPPP